MSTKKLIKIALLIGVLLSVNIIFAQDDNAETSSESVEFKPKINERFGTAIRGSNAVSVAVGSAVMNGDLSDPLFEIYFHAGYKRFLGRQLNINFIYHKFNLAYKDQFNNGFMSFDLSLEFNFMPDNAFTPFIFAGGGLHAANYFTTTNTKIHGGAGVELLVMPRLGLKLFADYNHIFDDELDGLVFGDADDIYWRMGFGLNMYFGGLNKVKKLKKDSPTVIESNLIDGLK